MDSEESGWQYFFDNRGRCPKCNGYLVPLMGCKEVCCVDIVEKKLAKRGEAESQQRDRKMYLAQNCWKKYKKQFDEYWTFLRQRSLMRYLAKDIDNTNKKSYSKNI
jgi:hypothetical protein